MKQYRGYKYKITARSDGRRDFDVWRAETDVRRAVSPFWSGTVKDEAAAERFIKAWIDDHQPRPSKKRKRSR